MNNRFPAQLYTILRHKWRANGYDDSRISNDDIDRLAEDHKDHVHVEAFVAGRLGDGSLIRWLEAHKELIQLLFTLGKFILPLILM